MPTPRDSPPHIPTGRALLRQRGTVELRAETYPAGITARPVLCHKQPYVEARHGFENYASSIPIGKPVSDFDRVPAMSNSKEVPAPSILRRQAALAFGSALRSARLDRGISQMNLAASSDLDPTYVSLMERGHRVPSFIVIIRLADALDISPVQLFAEGVARLPGTAPVDAKTVYRLASQLADGQLVEAEAVYSDFVAAMRSAELENITRRKSADPEITHLVKYLRTNAIDLGKRIPQRS